MPDSAEEARVAAFLRDHPDFLLKNPDLAAALAAPAPQQGKVVDFQAFQLQAAQHSARGVQERLDAMVEFCRASATAQSRSQQAVLKLLRARSLEQVLSVVSQDLQALYNLDVLRLAVESPDVWFNPEDFGSGPVFVPPGAVAHALEGKKSRMVADAEIENVPFLPAIFTECLPLARSCALLAVPVENHQRPAVLAFGVRHAGRFQPGQGVEPLAFVAEVLGHQLTRYVDEWAP